MLSSRTLLRDLIALPSVNPQFAPAGSLFTGEARVADFLLATAARAGLAVCYQEVQPGRSNLLVRLTPAGSVQRRILLAPHLDTVGGDPLDSALFTPVEKNGRLHGRGACDTKGSVAAMMTALLTLADGSTRPQHTEITLVGFVDEENAQLGSRAFAAERPVADLAIVGEPTNGRAITAHKGDVWLELATRGRQAHGATPHLGVNAVHAMAHVVDLLETTYARALRRRRHRLLGTPTINVGTITGGTQPNVVPSRCTISIDRRTLPGETDTSVRRELRELFQKHGLKVSFDSLRKLPCLAMETDIRRPVVREFLAGLKQTAPLGVHYFCDAAVLSAAGIPSLVYGPGDIQQAHTADEWISWRELDRATAYLVKFLRSQP